MNTTKDWYPEVLKLRALNAELQTKLDALEDRYWSHGLCPTCDATELKWEYRNGELVYASCLVCNRERNG